MQQSRPKVTLTFLLTFFIIALTSTSCTSPKSSSYGEDDRAWKEPMWRQTGIEGVKLRWKFVPGDEVQYHERQKATITSEGETTELEHSVTFQYHVKDVSKEGIAQVLLSAKNLDTKGTGDGLFQFLSRSLHNLGSFSISPSGHMTCVTGLVGIRSLPTFPNDPLIIGSKWIDDVGILITPILPRAIMTGKCTYQLVGLTDVQGHKWAKITFEGDLELPKQEVKQKVIGVKAPAIPAQDVQGAIVGEVIAGSPAEKGGILPGDIIQSFGGMTVNTWLDLICVVAMSSHDKSAAMIVLRDNLRKELFVKPCVSSSGQIEIKGCIKGVIVFDATLGGLVRIQISPFSRHALIRTGDKTTEREIHVNSITQLVK
ncbi:MAG: PDZ domain-containing protein [Thermodesulfobacteriota bacterium]|nr:PDZ domain-containing protein [Thermodesulfobacteriota bacterium]